MVGPKLQTPWICLQLGDLIPLEAIPGVRRGAKMISFEEITPSNPISAVSDRAHSTKQRTQPLNQTREDYRSQIFSSQSCELSSMKGASIQVSNIQVPRVQIETSPNKLQFLTRHGASNMRGAAGSSEGTT